jgi:hypothetical protein
MQITDSDMDKVQMGSLGIPIELSKVAAILSGERVEITSCIPNRLQIPYLHIQEHILHTKYRRQST